MRTLCAQYSTHHWASPLMMWTAGCWRGVSTMPHGATATSIRKGVEVLGGRVADRLITVEGRDWVFGALRWWRHCWDGGGVLVAFVGSEGVECGGDDVLGLSIQDDVALCAEIFA